MNATIRGAARAALGAIALVSATTSVFSQDARPQELATVDLAAGAATIHAQVARSERERATGLMFRDTLPPSDGMLFVFGDPQRRCFWMRNTRIALDAAFIADDGEVVNIAGMAPLTEDSHCPERPVRFVLEMNRDWFASHGVAAGSYLTGEPFTR